MPQMHLVILDRYVEIGSVIQSLGKARKDVVIAGNAKGYLQCPMIDHQKI
jgi:hypothetical protein